MSEIDYEVIIKKLKDELETESAIANKYGVVLASILKEFSKGKIIPQKILELIASSKDIASELKLKRINSFVLEAMDYNYLFTFSEELILISRLDLSVNLAKFMPSISVFLKNLSKGSKGQIVPEFSEFDFSKEIAKMKETINQEKYFENKYKIIKDLVKFIST